MYNALVDTLHDLVPCLQVKKREKHSVPNRAKHLIL